MNKITIYEGRFNKPNFDKTLTVSCNKGIHTNDDNVVDRLNESVQRRYPNEGYTMVGNVTTRTVRYK